MQRISQVLQFPVIIEWSGPPTVEPQSFQKRNFRLSSTSAQNAVSKEPFEPRLFFGRPFGLSFHKLELLWVARSQSSV